MTDTDEILMRLAFKVIRVSGEHVHAIMMSAAMGSHDEALKHRHEWLVAAATALGEAGLARAIEEIRDGFNPEIRDYPCESCEAAYDALRGTGGAS